MTSMHTRSAIHMTAFSSHTLSTNSGGLSSEWKCITLLGQITTSKGSRFTTRRQMEAMYLLNLRVIRKLILMRQDTSCNMLTLRRRENFLLGSITTSRVSDSEEFNSKISTTLASEAVWDQKVQGVTVVQQELEQSDRQPTQLQAAT
ncbi:uncharacterized protein LOC142357866 [Convolutriloba macropyga]|uniref:uncharacterized protein LOC142357866 n=1 Tax=Convolutriloba macropyga TaxID=536237 RepID=UPI003F52618B